MVNRLSEWKVRWWVCCTDGWNIRLEDGWVDDLKMGGMQCG